MKVLNSQAERRGLEEKEETADAGYVAKVRCLLTNRGKEQENKDNGQASNVKKSLPFV